MYVPSVIFSYPDLCIMQSDDDDDSACMRSSRTDCFPTECLTHKWPGRARAFPKDLEAARPSAVIHSGGGEGRGSRGRKRERMHLSLHSMRNDAVIDVDAASLAVYSLYPALIRSSHSPQKRVLCRITVWPGTTNQHNMNEITEYEKGRRMTHLRGPSEKSMASSW
jgi:hypothetical protein